MHTRVTACRCCGSSAMTTYLDLGQQPLANAYHHGEPQPVFPLAVQRCERCGLSQLTTAVDPALMFGDYRYVTGTSSTLVAHQMDLARDAMARHGRARTVLDVAANDGTLLEAFRDLGCAVHGVEPAANLREITARKGIPVTVEFWGADTKLGQRFDIITATSVFAHVADQAGFLTACRKHLEPDGLLLIEHPYCRTMIDECHFDTIYHEHACYFLASPLLRLFARCGFYASHVVRTDIHGGSLRWILRADGGWLHCQEAFALAWSEADDGFLGPKKYQAFAAMAVRKREQLRALFDGGQAIGYGAAAKGNVLLNYCGADLRYIVEDNPLKHGYLTPGRNVPIVPVSRLDSESGDLTVLVTPWTFAAEVESRLRTIRNGHTTRLVYHVPAVHTVIL